MLDAHFERGSGSWSGAEANEVRYLVGRLSGLPRFPREIAGTRELALALAGCVSVHHAETVIDEVLSTWKECPTPAALREVMHARRPATRNRQRCPECHGEQWVSVPMLVTYPHDHWPAPGMRPTSQERVARPDGGWASHDEAMEMAENLPGNQTIVSAAVPCGRC